MFEPAAGDACRVGAAVGIPVGLRLGLSVGQADGDSVGASVGLVLPLGACDDPLGLAVGAPVSLDAFEPERELMLSCVWATF